MHPVLAASRLTKRYGTKTVVDTISFECQAGTVLGLLGANGAGKTTTIRMLYGLVDPDAGTIRYHGRDLREDRTALKRLIGVCTQEDTLDYDFNVRQNLEMYLRYFRPISPHDRERVSELIARFGLAEYEGYKPARLSGGFRRRLMIARSIVHRPPILFLDEPTTGLDPRARVDVWELISAMRAEGMAIILTTHYMDEAEKLSDELLVLKEGREMAKGPPRVVLGDLLGEHILVLGPALPDYAEMLAWLSREVATPQTSVLGELWVPLRNDELARFSDRFSGSRFEIRAPNLDDLFLTVTAGRSDTSPQATPAITR